MQKQFTIRYLSKEGRQVSMQVRQKNQKINERKVKTWTGEEDNQLLQLYERFPKKWGEIASLMHQRNQNQCLHRYRRLSKLGKSHKIWSSEEDDCIRKMIKKYGKNWKLLSEMLGTKNGKQIRERFINKLDPKIRKEDWTEQEDMKILQLYSKVGSKWSQISRQLVGRPENKIKNRFYSFIQKNYDITFKDSQNIDPVKNKAGSEAKIESIFVIDLKSSICDQKQQRSHKVLMVMDENRPSEERISSKFQIPSINNIEFDMKNQSNVSNNLLESVLRVQEDWKATNNYQSIIELHSTDLFSKFQN